MLTFVLIKSLSMGLSGVRGIVLAVVLGPATYGIFGTLIVVQQYLSYLALGMREGVAIKLARIGDSPGETGAVYGSALTWGAFSGIAQLVAITYLHTIGLVASDVMWIGLISLCSITNEILININRNEHKLRKVAAIELTYNAAALLIVVSLRERITVSLALQAVLVSTMLSVFAYLATLRGARWREVAWAKVRELLTIGILPALFSAALVVLNSFYVLAASWMKLRETVGLVVFGNNISTVILFGLNAVSWGLASRSMARHYASSSARVASQEDTADVVLRLGMVAAAVLALATRIVFSFTLKQYAGAQPYIVYLCLYQAYGVLLFSELNFLNVNSKLALVVPGYLLMLAVLATACGLASQMEFLQLVQGGVVLYLALSLGITIYCRRLGFQGGDLRHRMVWLCFPAICALAYAVAGVVGGMCVCAAFFLTALHVYRARLATLMAVRSLW